MITVEIPKKELLSQLPEQAGYALLQWLDQMPETFVFQGLPVKTRAEVVKEKYPIAYKVFSHMEWALFLSLYNRGEVKYNTLMYDLKLENSRGFIGASNILTVHINHLRKKMQIHNLPFQITTYPMSQYRPGAFKMVEVV